MKRTLTALALLLVTTTASAHSGHAVSGFTSGLLHPFSGLDHLLAMLAVGLWAGQSGGQRVWQLPATFMALLASGALAGMTVPGLPLIEPGIAASVLILGLLIASPSRLALPVSFTLTAAFGLCHGYAHGSEMPGAATPQTYAAGFLLATAALHLAGLALGQTLHRHHRLAGRALGAGIAGSGAWLLAALAQ